MTFPAELEKTAEQIAEKLWEKYGDDVLFSNHLEVSMAAFYAALHEYGDAVRQKAAGVCQTVPCDCDLSDGHDCVVFQCAAAIERMELP